MSSPRQLNPFGDVDLDSWKRKALADLKGKTLESLDRKTPEGLTRKVLYTATDRPAALPKVSGGRAGIAQIHRVSDPQETRERLEGELELGAKAAVLELEAEIDVAALLPEGLERVWVIGEPAGELPGSCERVHADVEGGLAGEGHRLAIDSTWAYEAGLGPVEELALFAAKSAALLRAAEAKGHDASKVADAAWATFSVDTDFFLGLAKLRVARLLWAQLLGACGVEASKRRLEIHARAGRRAWAARPDAMWVNLLRACTQGFSAQLAGADWVALPTFDGGRSDEGRRLATNMQVILREESFAGEVEDPAAGSYYLESLCEQLRELAWSRFQSIEAEGGIDAYLERGEVERRAVQQQVALSKQLATGKRVLVGVSRFVTDDAGPALDGVRPEKAPFTGERLGAAFEALRERGAKAGVEVQLLVAGELRHYKARADFARDWLAAGGLPLSEARTEVEAPKALLLCAADGSYGPLIEAAKQARAAGCRWVGAVTRPGPKEGDEAELEASIDAFVHMRADLPEVLSTLIDRVGGAQ
jgi:methylmalonyl-CoA mutase